MLKATPNQARASPTNCKGNFFYSLHNMQTWSPHPCTGGGDDFQQSSSAWRCNVEELRVARTNQPHKQALTLGAEKVFKL